MALALRSRLTTIGDVLHRRFSLWLILTLSFTVGYYLLLMASLILRFGNLPNYARVYNWPESVWTIVRSTPSIRDMPPIIAEEYLLEFGYMNYDYGLGISEWALNIIPYKVVLMLVLSGLLAANLLLLRTKTSCSTGSRLKAGAATGLGAGFVAVTSATMSWVVCCATPTWIVGLSMLGLGVSTAFWIEPIGPWLTAAGYLLLCFSLIALSKPSDTGDGQIVEPAPSPKISTRKGAHA